MKRGTIVAVCHDGKWSRRVKGVVVDTRNGHHVKVMFKYLDGESERVVTMWVKKRPAIRYLRNRKESCISYGKRPPNTYAGWADVHAWCPWFVVKKWKE